MQQHRVIRSLEKLERLHQQGQIVAVDGAKVFEAELLEQDRRPEHALGGFFGAARQGHCRLAAQLLHDALGGVVQVLVVLVGDNLVEVAGNGAHVAVDRPFVVVEHDDHPLGLLGNVVQRLKRDAVGKSRVAGHGNHMLLAASQVARHGHAQSRRERRASVPGAEAVVLALGAQHEAVQPARLANGVKAVEAAGENLVNIGLVADIEQQFVFGSIEDRVQRQRKFHDAEVRSQVPAGL